jgi:hypothetical protein
LRIARQRVFSRCYLAVQNLETHRYFVALKTIIELSNPYITLMFEKPEFSNIQRTGFVPGRRRLAANAAAAYSPTLQRGVNKHPRRLGREYGRSRFTASEF